VPFACFKAKLAALKAQHTSTTLVLRQAPKNVLQQVVVQAFTESFTESVIKAAFENTGIHPFDEKKILDRAAEVTSQDLQTLLAQPRLRPLRRYLSYAKYT